MDGDDAAGTMGAAFRAWGVRKHSPPSERGVPPAGRRLQECTFGVDGKGGGGSTAGGRRGMLPHGSSAKGLSFVAGIELCLAATPPRSTPPAAAPAACLFPAMDIPSMAAPPPSRRGGVSCRPPCALHSWNSRGASTITPEGPSFCAFSQFLQLRENRAKPPLSPHPSHHEHFPSLPPADWCSPLVPFSKQPPPVPPPSRRRHFAALRFTGSQMALW